MCRPYKRAWRRCRPEGKPNVSLTVGAGSTRDLGTANSRFEHSLSGSLVASVPLFDSTAQQAREQQIQAQVNSREAVIEQVQRDVHAELWRNALANSTLKPKILTLQPPCWSWHAKATTSHWVATSPE
jgi:outer membrane protein TolC